MSENVIGLLRDAGARLDIEWTIPDFLLLSTELYKHYNSPMYFIGDTSWYIRIYPYDEKNCKKEYIGVYVVRGDSGPPVTAIYSLSLKTAEGRKVGELEYKETFSGKEDESGVWDALERSQLIEHGSEFLPSGALTIICTLKFDGEREVKGFESKRLAAAVQDMKLIRDYRDLLLSGKNCDVTLQVKGQKFEAHRAILGARSPVFASMLSHDMKEKNTGLIDIEDCDPEYFPDFSSFLYCGSVDSITSQNMCSLYRAADKYNVQDFKSECLAFIRNHLDVDNFCDVISLALQHNEADLAKQSTDFFVSNMLKIVVTVKWQVFLRDNSTEGNELIIKAAHKFSSP